MKKTARGLKNFKFQISNFKFLMNLKHSKGFKHIGNYKLEIRNWKLTIKHKLFLLDRKILCHPVLRYGYPQPGFVRRFIAGMMAFVVFGTGFLIYVQPGKVDAAWYSDSWKFRKLITIDNAMVANTDQTNFPVLINISDAGLAANAQSTGNDIIFTSSDGSTKLSHEIEKYTSSDGHLIAWVKIPSLSASADTNIYIYYGNASASNQEDITNVWDTNFKGVWHMNETSGQLSDSTSNAHDSTSVSVVEQGTAGGKVDGADTFNGSSSTITVPDHNDFNQSAATIETWVKFDATPSSLGHVEYVVNKNNSTSPFTSFLIRANNPSNIITTCFVDSTPSAHCADSSTTVTPGTWYHIVGTYDGSNIRTYINGSADGGPTAMTGSILDSNENFRISCDRNPSSCTQGTIDEVRFSSTNRSADWISTEYKNQNSPSSYVSIGTKQEQKGSPVLYWNFDEGTGTTTSDASTYSNSGTISGATWQSKDMCLFGGRCLKFDGSSDKVSKTYSTDTELDPGTASFSVSAWFKHPASISTNQYLIARSNGATNGIGYKIYMNSSGKVCFGIDDDATSFPDDDACSTSTYTDSYWHHVEAVKNGTTSITLYVDGKQVDQDGTLAATATLSGSSPTFYVGIDGDGSSNSWDGFIDEVKYFDYAKTADQVKADFAAKGSVLGASTVFGAGDAATSVNQGLVGYWKMDDGVGNACASGVNKACDSSGNGNDGTWTGNTASTSGKFGFATTYDGTDDYVNVGDPSSGALDFGTNSFTVSQWVNPSSNVDQYDMSLNKGGASPGGTGYDFELGSSAWQANISDGTTQVQGTLAAAGNLNTWSHIAFVVDRASKTMRTYLNGELVDTDDISTFGSVSNTRLLTLGADDSVSFDFAGKIDETRIYNRALSSREMRSLYEWAAPPIGHWKFDEHTGINAYDSSGIGSTGTLTNGPTWQTGKVGGAVSLDGANDYVNVTHDQRYSFPNIESYTISFWVNSGANSGTTEGILSKDGGPANRAGWEIFRQNNANNIIMERRDSSGAYLTECDVSFTPNTWTYVTYTYDGSTISCYKNGVFASSAANSGSLGNSTGDITIGTMNTNVDFWDGRLDDLKIYNYARTPKQVVQDMNGGHPAVGTPIGSPVGHWSFDEGYGTTANDKTPLDNDLTLSSATWITSGKFGKAWNGAGTNWVSRADDADFDFVAADDFSISTWFKSDSEANPGATEYLVNKQAGIGYSLYLKTNGRVCLGIDDDATFTPDDEVCSVADVYDKQWHHVVATKIDGAKIQISVDGRLNTIDGNISATGTLANSATLYLGDDDGDSTNAFNGDIDETKIYRYALNQDEVRTEYNQGKAVTLGALSTDANGNATNSAARYYCPPGDSDGNCAAGSDPSPLGEWKLDDHTGSTANDTSGRGNAGTLTGGPSWIPGKIGTGLLFDGSSQYVDIPHNAVFNNTSAITVEAWVKPNATSSTYAVLDKVSGNCPESWTLYLEGDQFAFSHKRESGPGCAYNGRVYSPTVSVGNWYHVVGVYDGSNNYLYINGILVDKATTTEAMTTNTNAIRIGARTGGSPLYFPGRVDDARIYDYARSARQIAWDYNKGKPTSWWKFDECTGSTLYDTAWTASGSASRVNGTLTNATAGTCTDSASTAWYNGRTGRFNSALDFDGTDDVVSIANDDKIWLNKGLKNGFTISTWVNADSDGEGDVGQIFNKGSTTFCRTKNQVGSHLDLECSLDLATTDATITVGNAFDTSGWHNVVLSWTDDSDDEVTVWIDGKRRGSSNDGNGIAASENNALFIGGSSAGGATAFDGRIDQLMIFPYEMTSSMIKTLYNENSSVRMGPASGRP